MQSQDSGFIVVLNEIGPGNIGREIIISAQRKELGSEVALVQTDIMTLYRGREIEILAGLEFQLHRSLPAVSHYKILPSRIPRPEPRAFWMPSSMPASAKLDTQELRLAPAQRSV